MDTRRLGCPSAPRRCGPGTRVARTLPLIASVACAGQAQPVTCSVLGTDDAARPSNICSAVEPLRVRVTVPAGAPPKNSNGSVTGAARKNSGCSWRGAWPPLFVDELCGRVHEVAVEQVGERADATVPWGAVVAGCPQRILPQRPGPQGPSEAHTADKTFSGEGPRQRAAAAYVAFTRHPLAGASGCRVGGLGATNHPVILGKRLYGSMLVRTIPSCSRSPRGVKTFAL